MSEKLDKERILILLVEADSKWFNNQPSPMDYRKHLEFSADYIVKNYKRKAGK